MLCVRIFPITLSGSLFIVCIILYLNIYLYNIIYYFIRMQRELTGVDDLEKVHFLELKVETSDTSLGNFGINLPNLMQLKLTNSVISSIR